MCFVIFSFVIVMRKNTGFTLVEVLVSVTLTGVILLTGYSAFQKIMQSQWRLWAIIDIQKNLFYTNEKLAALIRDGGTLDHEEYFNRRMLGYSRITTGGIYTFTNFSHFGNGNVASKPPIYYCGMVNTVPDPHVSTWVNAESCMNDNTNVLIESSPLWTTATYHFPTTESHQAYGQYAALAFNYLDPVWYPIPIMLPPVFKAWAQVWVFTRDTSTNRVVDKNVSEVWLPELYLIKKNLDNSYVRTYFRHVYVDDPFVTNPTCDPTLSAGAATINGCLWKIQMTKLEGCDSLPVGMPDGIIDAWIPLPDFMIWTVFCPSVDTDIYKAAHEETITTGGIAPNITWVDVTAPEMNVIRATFLPHPLKIPSLMIGAGEKAEAPRVSVYLEVILSTRLRNKSFVRPDKNYPRTLITTYDLSE